MSVYIDDMYKYPMGRFGRMKMSHMIADTESELHEMAVKIGLDTKWYQGDHYDVSISLRSKAIANGAIEIELRELSRMCKVRRETGTLPEPQVCVSFHKDLLDSDPT
jgi:hypothetical protein